MQNAFWTSTARRQSRKRVLGGRAEVVLVGPGRRLAGAVLVRDPPDRTDAGSGRSGPERKLVHLCP